MDAVIDTILSAKNFSQLFKDLFAWKAEFKVLASKLHPDICKDPRANDALVKLNQFKDQIEKGRVHRDEVAEIRFFPSKIDYIGDEAMLASSASRLQELYRKTDKESATFLKYLPTACQAEKGKLTFEIDNIAVPLSALPRPVEQKHVNWIASRMIEFAGWMAQIGYSHLGLNPDSIYVVPETHGIYVTSFYHMTKLGSRVKTLNGPYLGFYPSSLLTTKTATPDIDLECVKRIAIYLLGDTSGSGNILKKNPDVNQAILLFYQKHYSNPVIAFREYRDLIRREFKKEFIPFENF